MVVIGENTYNAVKDQFECSSLGTATLKGKEKEVAVYEVIDRLAAGGADVRRLAGRRASQEAS